MGEAYRGRGKNYRYGVAMEDFRPGDKFRTSADNFPRRVEREFPQRGAGINNPWPPTRSRWQGRVEALCKGFDNMLKL